MLNVVIGSYGSYSACNERAYGSKWINLEDFKSFDEIKSELIKEGFKLNGIDEELFFQDYESDLDLRNLENYSVSEFINLIYESKILIDDENFSIACAICEAYGMSQLVDDLREYGEYFTDEYIFYQNKTLEDLAYEFVEEMDLPEFAIRYFDYGQFADDLEFDNYTEVSNGVIYC